MDILKKYFEFNELQDQQFQSLFDLYRDWNEKINLISRKDIDNLEIHHFLHSLSIYKFIQFKEGSHILDLGSGGGFPGIMLAIMMPKVNFILIDGRNKKIKVVNEIVASLNLKNVIGIHGRAEEYKKQKFDFIVSRAVASIDKLREWSRPLIGSKHKHGLPNGLISLKGGDMKKELSLLYKKDAYELLSLSSYFEEAYFLEKYILYLQL